MSIKDAYRNLAKKFHPDAGGDDKSFQQLNELYEEAQRTEVVYQDRPVYKDRVVYVERGTNKPINERHVKNRAAGINDRGNIIAFAQYANESGLSEFLKYADDDTLSDAMTEWLYKE